MCSDSSPQAPNDKGRESHLRLGRDPARPSGTPATMSKMRGCSSLVALALVLRSARLQATFALDPPRNALEVPGTLGAHPPRLRSTSRPGRRLFARNPDPSLAPASNEKLPMTLAALRELGPSYRFRTEVLGARLQDGDVWDGDLVPQGLRRPDPHVPAGSSGSRRSCSCRDHARRRPRVRRRIVVRRARAAPGWKPSFLIYECPPLSALSSTATSTTVTSRSSRRSPPRAVPHSCCAAHGVIAGAGRPSAARRRGRRLAHASPSRCRNVIARDGSRQRQLHGRGAAEGSARRSAPAGTTLRAPRSSPATSRRSASRSPACGSSTARASPLLDR